MRLDTKEDLETKYATEDPWGFRDHTDDAIRKARILKACNAWVLPDSWAGPFDRALDIGAGEGWITKDLPAREIWAYEISDRAAGRLPDGVRRWSLFHGGLHGMQFDLITACGVFYAHYDYLKMQAIIDQHAAGIVVTCHLEDSEIPLDAVPIFEERFPYRGRVQRLAVYDFSGGN